MFVGSYEEEEKVEVDEEEEDDGDDDEDDDEDDEDGDEEEDEGDEVDEGEEEEEDEEEEVEEQVLWLCMILPALMFHTWHVTLKFVLLRNFGSDTTVNWMSLICHLNCNSLCCSSSFIDLVLLLILIM